MKFYDLIPQHAYDTATDVIRSNVNILYGRMLQIEKLCNLPIEITSGFRSLEHHIEIYKKKMGKDFSMKKVPLKSLHLTGEAVDIYDKNGKLFLWCYNNVSILENVCLWVENDQGVPRVHFQSRPPKSGQRFFLP